ncbi:endonuclease/exonuclease/phosphatase family protein [Conchiformibius kuhniae]|uniref:Endonuclease/exonuclease/phosphatase family protein n=1 Tax=Conchiformibius kuhniae TaxID=211502 RepID=A0ABD8B6V3_9NEIS|nr:endonuclease/exonuclease/phosphatase family protein [Conchiformibius kuhniae]
MRILSYNIQAAIGANSYFSYVSRLHRQVLPDPAKTGNLQRIAAYIAAFDAVCIQEIDLGGLRNGFRCQAAQLCQAAGFAHHVAQTNRVVGQLSRHGNLILCRTPLRPLISETLPSRIKGRGILAAATDTPHGELVLANVHLSLGASDQLRQVRHICRLLEAHPQICLCGDFNCPPESAALALLREAGYRRVGSNAPTYPSWRPRKTLDHIFIKGALDGHCCTDHTFTASDHLPVCAELR